MRAFFMAMKKPANRFRSRALFFKGNDQGLTVGLFRLGFNLNRCRGFLAGWGTDFRARSRRCWRDRGLVIVMFNPIVRRRRVRHPVANVVRDRTVRRVRIALTRLAPTAFERATTTATTATAAATTAFITRTAAVGSRLALTCTLTAGLWL